MWGVQIDVGRYTSVTHLWYSVTVSFVLRIAVEVVMIRSLDRGLVVSERRRLRESLSWWAESGIRAEAQLTNVKTLAPPSWFWHSILNCCDPGGFRSSFIKIIAFPCFRILKKKTGTWAVHNFVTSKPCLLPCQSFLRARSSPLKNTNPLSQETCKLYKAQKAILYQYRTQYYWYKWKQALRDILVIYLTQNI